MSWEPKILGLLCNWCSYQGADLAGTSRMKYPPNLRIVRLMCSGRVDAATVMWALKSGADGVLVGGCHPGDCHYTDGNLKTMRRVPLLKKMLTQLGVEEDRVRHPLQRRVGQGVIHGRLLGEGHPHTPQRQQRRQPEHH